MKHKDNYATTFFGKLLYDTVIPEFHPFRLLLITIDWGKIRKELMTDEHGVPIQYSTIGRPALDPLVVFKMLLLQRWHPVSDAKVEERAQTDIAYRFFLQVPIPESVPDKTTLSRYRTKWGVKKLEMIYKLIYQQIQTFGLSEVNSGIAGDITHQHA